MPSAGTRAAAIDTQPGAALFGKIQALVEQTVAATKAAFHQQFVNVLVSLLTPASMLALVFGLWRVSEDLGWTEAFVIPSGLFSHWQVWIALAIALKMAASSLQAGTRAGAKTSEEN
jgi:hypothetical protein